MTVVCEVGPATVRVLHPPSGDVRGRALAEAALDACDEPLTLLGEEPVATDVLWRAVFEKLLAGADAALLVHPSWWSPTRVANVAGAARQVVATVTTSPRFRLLHRGAAFVEIGPEFIAVGDRSGHTDTETRWSAVDVVADAVAARVGGDCGPVHVDAPVGVPGAAALGFLITRRLRSAGKTVRQLDDRYLQLAAQRSVRCRTAVSASAEPTRRRGLPAGAVAGAAVITGLTLAGLLSQHRSGAPATELVEGRVAVRIPAHWSVRRVTEGPGSARVEAVSPSDPDAVLHITQSPVPTDDLAATAKALQLAAQTQPPGVFVDFNPADRLAGRPAVTYREVRPGRDIRWTVVVTGRVRIGIGCQSAAGRGDYVEGACAQAISSAREIS